MHRKLLRALTLVTVVSLASGHADPKGARADAGGDPDAIHYAGSVLLTLFNVPYKMVTCITGQTVGGMAYVMTAGVPGNYNEGTNGPEIGEVASGSCAGEWLISPQQVQEDYGNTDELDLE